MTDRKTRVLSNLLAIVLGVGIGAGCYRIVDRITENRDPGIKTESPLSEGGAILNVTESKGMNLTATLLSSEEYEESGISPLAESAYTLTATVYPEDAGNRAVDWLVEFVNAASTWASGKVVTDYVTVTPTSDGSLTAGVVCKKGFGEQIRVRVTSRDNVAATAACTVDYTKKVTGYTSVVLRGSDRITPSNTMQTLSSATLTNGFFVMSYNMDFTVTGIVPTPVYSDYTIDDTFAYSYMIASTSQWLQTLQTAIPDLRNSISSTIATTPEPLFTESRGTFVIGRYTGINVLNGSEVSTIVSSLRNSASGTNAYLSALNTYAAGYANYPILYFYVRATGSYSNYTTYYYMKLDTSSAAG